jgi:cellulose synthase operon protein YhjU
MGYWNVYFIGKLYLYLTQRIGFHPLPNLLFALALCMPLASHRKAVVRQWLAVPAGIALFYYDSHLPPFARFISQFGNIASFTPAYLWELTGRFVTFSMVLSVIGLLALYWLFNHWLRITTFSLCAIVAMPLALAVSAVCQRPDTLPLVAGGRPGAASGSAASVLTVAGNPEESFKAFLQGENLRQVAFPLANQRSGPAFDVIILHICSLSWDDLDVARVPTSPFFGKFDLVFRQFNSAASYSGPAAIRVLRASCGQPAHEMLYQSAPAQCHILHELKQAGFAPEIVMNHDGHFDNFAKYVEDNVGEAGIKPASFAGVPVEMRAFDDSPLLDNYQTLAHWFQARQASGAPAVALYYNTISLHDGNHLPGNGSPSLQTYPLRIRKLLDDFDRFMALIAQSGRRAVVIFVPEHGAALQGDDEQVAGLREIPTWRITHVPAAVKFVGATFRQAGGPITIDKPVSYLALAQLLADSARQNPFSGPVSLADWASRLPATAPVAENEGTIVMHRASGDVMRSADGVWLGGKR